MAPGKLAVVENTEPKERAEQHNLSIYGSEKNIITLSEIEETQEPKALENYLFHFNFVYLTGPKIFKKKEQCQCQILFFLENSI